MKLSEVSPTKNIQTVTCKGGRGGLRLGFCFILVSSVSNHEILTSKFFRYFRFMLFVLSEVVCLNSVSKNFNVLLKQKKNKKHAE